MQQAQEIESASAEQEAKRNVRKEGKFHDGRTDVEETTKATPLSENEGIIAPTARQCLHRWRKQPPTPG